ncbi:MULTISPECIES: DUF84 family protein [Cytobacillus]|uniref:inosine/xanthosine triphosphatase n=1 Tax=Cytobacillus stercorigallinarum TaxID=2762240 RepID=A0ABR8QJ34_9BACI|nr:DUF84 family protein [Cytobacillus stercorigallinarum]MBD7935498.1 DUF84 family protein [Cytobacillus stercorigallinarum]
MKIYIGSKNPTKVQAVKNIFIENSEVIAVDVASNVAKQPMTDQETIQGAINRAKGALYEGDGVIGIGLEGGVQQTDYGLFLCNWGALAVEGHTPIVAGGARILLPDSIAQRLIEGEELGPVMDDFTNKNNIRSQEGAIGVFTANEINREEMFTHLVKLLYGQWQYRNRGE